MKFYNDYKKSLEKNEVFVFGANYDGFHGAGSAGWASFNKAGNVWRDEGYSLKPHGWKGEWCVKGCAEGFQKGTVGKSYAIPTVTKPGAKRSIPLAKIAQSIKSFYAFALAEPQLKFFVAQDAKPGLNGWSPEDMAEAYLTITPPDNVYFYKPFYDILKSRI